jgi:Flp pilus assembly protein TadB
VETRLIVAYALIVLMAFALAFALWRLATRNQRRHRRMRAQRTRALQPPVPAPTLSGED